jgi:hypothetical protein
MKCPKCGYITFDYNTICPKCSKDIVAKKDGLNWPSYRPSPPFLSGSLIGKTGKSEIAAVSPGLGPDQLSEAKTDIDQKDFQAIEAMEEAFKDSRDLESLDSSGLKEENPESTDQELSLSLEEESTLDEIGSGEISGELLPKDDITSEELAGKTGGDGDDIEIELESLQIDLEPENHDDKSS